jgi:O-antigen/teichoic acid export membrane protein
MKMQDGDKKRVIWASTYTIIGFGLSQVIRFGSNLVLTRLLVPEFFGLVNTAYLFFAAIALLSDIGLEPSVIRSSRSGETIFLNTTWTIQFFRSAAIGIITMGISYPIAKLYGEPILTPLICAMGFSSIVFGLQSTSLIILRKNMDQKKLVLLDLITQAISTAFIISCAFAFRSLWTLVLGNFIPAIIKVFWSHSINKEHPNKFAFERATLYEVLTFGKWILFSTAITYLASQLDRILLGKFFGMAWFGVYGIALNMAELPKSVVLRLNAGVVLPLVSKYVHLPREDLRKKIKAPRGLFLYPMAVLMAVIACFGDYMIGFLFDNRYRDACWILPLLIIGSWPSILMSTIDGCLLAIGKPNYSAFGNLAKLIYMVIAVPLGYKLGGVLWAVIAVSFNGLFSYIVFCYGMLREKVSLIWQDVLASLAFLLFIALFIGVRLVAGLGITGVSAYLAS